MSPTRNHDFVPSVMPFALFPLTAELAALLICDYIVFDITAAPERIARKMTRYGINADIPLAPANDTLTAPDAPIQEQHTKTRYDSRGNTLDVTDPLGRTTFRSSRMTRSSSNRCS